MKTILGVQAGVFFNDYSLLAKFGDCDRISFLFNFLCVVFDSNKLVSLNFKTS